jgi:hypothetical protein
MPIFFSTVKFKRLINIETEIGVQKMGNYNLNNLMWGIIIIFSALWTSIVIKRYEIEICRFWFFIPVFLVLAGIYYIITSIIS